MSDKPKKAAKAAKLHKDKMACNKPRRDINKKSVVKACDNPKDYPDQYVYQKRQSKVARVFTS